MQCFEAFPNVIGIEEGKKPFRTRCFSKSNKQPNCSVSGRALSFSASPWCCLCVAMFVFFFLFSVSLQIWLSAEPSPLSLSCVLTISLAFRSAAPAQPFCHLMGLFPGEVSLIRQAQPHGFVHFLLSFTQTTPSCFHIVQLSAWLLLIKGSSRAGAEALFFNNYFLSLKYQRSERGSEMFFRKLCEETRVFLPVCLSQLLDQLQLNLTVIKVSEILHSYEFHEK